MVQQLIGAEPEDFDDLRIQAVDGAFGKRHNQMIEGRSPPLHTRRDIGGERAIAVVLEADPRKGDRGRKVGAAGRHGGEDVVRCDTRRRDHGVAVRRSPGASG